MGTTSGLGTLSWGTLILLIGRAATALWCVLGSLHTGIALARSGTGPLATPGGPSVRAIGVPLQPGSVLVARTLALIEDAAPGAAPILVVLPERADSLSRDVAQQQLAHLAYPRRVDVLPAADRIGAAGPDPAYGYAVALSPLWGGGCWEAIAGRDGLTLYRRRVE